MKNVKKTTHSMEKVITNNICAKRFVSRIYKERLQLNDKINNNPIKKCAKGLNTQFSKEDLQVSNKLKKRFSTS